MSIVLLLYSASAFVDNSIAATVTTCCRNLFQCAISFQINLNIWKCTKKKEIWMQRTICSQRIANKTTKNARQFHQWNWKSIFLLTIYMLKEERSKFSNEYHPKYSWTIKILDKIVLTNMICFYYPDEPKNI